MTVVLALLVVQALIGAFDTLYFHEYRARLVARVPVTTPELRLHGVRSVIYAVVFATFPWVAWQGAWAWLLGVLLLLEIVITLADFVVEDSVRASQGGVFAGERVTHAIMGIIYGAMLANLFPVWRVWAELPTALAVQPAGDYELLRFALAPLAVGVFVSGVRDLLAIARVPIARWPWAVM